MDGLIIIFLILLFYLIFSSAPAEEGLTSKNNQNVTYLISGTKARKQDRVQIVSVEILRGKRVVRTIPSKDIPRISTDVNRRDFRGELKINKDAIDAVKITFNTSIYAIEVKNATTSKNAKVDLWPGKSTVLIE